MDWKTFIEQHPLRGEKILVIHEWLDYDFELHQPKRCWAIYECNYKSIKKDIYNGADRSIVDLIKLKMVAGEEPVNFLISNHFAARALHWAKLY